MQAAYKNMLLNEVNKKTITTNMRNTRIRSIKRYRLILIWIRLSLLLHMWTSFLKTRKKKLTWHKVSVKLMMYDLVTSPEPVPYADFEKLNSHFSAIVVYWFTTFYDLVLTDCLPLSSYDCLVHELDEFYFHILSSFNEAASIALDTILETYISVLPLFSMFKNTKQQWLAQFFEVQSVNYLSALNGLFYTVIDRLEINHFLLESKWNTIDLDFNMLWKHHIYGTVRISAASSSLGKLRDNTFKILRKSNYLRKHFRQVGSHPEKRPFFNSLFNIGRAPTVQPVSLNGSTTLHFITGCRFFWDHFFVRQESSSFQSFINKQEYVDSDESELETIKNSDTEYINRSQILKRTVVSKASAEEHTSAEASENELPEPRIFEPTNRVVRLGTFYNAVEDMFQDLFDVHKEICPIELEHADALNFNRKWFVSWMPEALRAFDEYLFNDNDILVFSSRMADAQKIRFVQKVYYAPFVIPVRFFEWLCFGERSVNKYLHILTYEHLHSLFFADDVSIVTHKYSCAAELNRAQDLLAEYTYTMLGHSYNLGIISI